MAHNKPRTERGAAAVEFALVSLLFLLLIGAVVQFSIWFWSYQVASHAAGEGARRYSVQPCATAANDALITNRVGSAANGPVTIAVTKTPPTNFRAGDTVVVQVSFSTYDLVGGVIPLPTEISKSATATIEDIQGC